MTQLSILALLGLASLMKDGSITVFNFAMNLQSVPLAIIGVSYSIAAFPTLAKCFSCGNKDEFLSAKKISQETKIPYSFLQPFCT